MSDITEETVSREVLDSIVSIECDRSGPTSIILENDWQREVTPAQLLAHLQALIQEELGTPKDTSSWRAHLSIKNVPVYRLKEFNALVSEARAEQRMEPPTQLQTVTSNHLTSRWLRGGIVSLAGDEEWMASATRQAVADELLQVLMRPADPADGAAPTMARERIVRFLEDCKQRSN